VAKKVSAKVASGSIHAIHRNVINARKALENAQDALIRANKAIRAEQIHLVNANKALARADKAIVANKARR
jgi:hypothetical protein